MGVGHCGGRRVVAGKKGSLMLQSGCGGQHERI